MLHALSEDEESTLTGRSLMFDLDEEHQLLEFPICSILPVEF